MKPLMTAFLLTAIVGCASPDLVTVADSALLDDSLPTTSAGDDASRTTVTPASGMAMAGCVWPTDANLVPGHCPNQPDPNPGGTGLWVDGWTPDNCFDPTRMGHLDADRDGVTDQCESELAYSFRPELVYSRDCNYDSGNARPAGDYVVAVRRKSGNRVRIAYLPAYFIDCGTSAYKIPAPGHSGDSEYIYMEVSYISSHWVLEGVKLSAHCGTASDACGWRSHSSLEWTDRRRGAPVVYVALAKHAHYPTRAICGRGMYGAESCSGRERLRYPISRNAYGSNIGSRGYKLIDCSRPRLSSSLATSSSQECYWTSRNFTGWQSPAYGSATPYSTVLTGLGF